MRRYTLFARAGPSSGPRHAGARYPPDPLPARRRSARLRRRAPAGRLRAGRTRHHAPIEDFSVPSEETLRAALDFLHAAEEAGEPVVVHCSAGRGRTGLVLVAWLVERHGLDLADAEDEVRAHAAEHGAVRTIYEVPAQQARAVIRAATAR